MRRLFEFALAYAKHNKMTLMKHPLEQIQPLMMRILLQNSNLKSSSSNSTTPEHEYHFVGFFENQSEIFYEQPPSRFLSSPSISRSCNFVENWLYLPHSESHHHCLSQCYYCVSSSWFLCKGLILLLLRQLNDRLHRVVLMRKMGFLSLAGIDAYPSLYS